MKEKLFNDKEIPTTKKYSLKKPLLLTVSLIFFFSLYFYLQKNKKNKR